MFAWLPENLSTYGVEVDRLFYVILAITTVVFISTEALLFFFLFKYRARRRGEKGVYTHGSVKLEIVWTAVPAAILVVLAFYSQKVWSDIRGTPPQDPFVVRVTARQFQWEFTYPGPDGVFGTDDDVESLNLLHVPYGRTILLELTSKDVIHSFFLPAFRIKQDAVPGLTSRVWFRPNEAARRKVEEMAKSGKTKNQWEIACAELCGLGHTNMRGFLTLESQADFDAWYKGKRK